MDKKSAGLGFCDVLVIVFIVLKLLKIIAWSWVWVLAPIWIPIVLLLICSIVLKLLD